MVCDDATYENITKWGRGGDINACSKFTILAWYLFFGVNPIIHNRICDNKIIFFYISMMFSYETGSPLHG